MKKSLGKGLDALFGEEIEEKIENIEGKNLGGITELKISEIEPNMKQPRKIFEQEKIENLAESIKENGIMQPIVVSKENNTYKIVAGERRWRAARVAGLKTVPVIIRNDLTDSKILELALIENIQRQDLNVLEEANAYQVLMDEYGMTQENVAKVVGKSRSAVANTVRLLNLDSRVQEMINENRISEAHGRAILPITSGDKQYEMALLIEKRGMTVRDIELLMRRRKKGKNNDKLEDIFTKTLEESMKGYFGTKVKIISKSNEKGKIVIEYMSNSDLDRIMDIMGMEKNY
jgi:ParB family chromosome partitioning protein